MKGEIGNIGKDQINIYHVKDFGLYSKSIGNPQKGFFFFFSVTSFTFQIDQLGRESVSTEDGVEVRARGYMENT